MNDICGMNWWKAPVLQGSENDYGDYDYLIEELPNNSHKWSTWGYKCSECGKYHKLNRIYKAYFRTMDGYDSLSTEVCWVCEVKSIINKPIWKLKRKFKLLMKTVELKREFTWKKCYELAKLLNK